MMKIEIRKFHLSDRVSVRKICWDTSFLENPTEFIDEEELLADFLTIYFTDYEPESCFVALDQERVVGYLIGTKDVRKMWRVFVSKIFPQLLMKFLQKMTLFKKKNLKFLFHVLRSFFKGEFISSDFIDSYPASFHVNFAKEYRRSGGGRALFEAYVQYLRSNDIKGVHVGTMSEAAMHFFSALDFKILHQSQRSYLQYQLGAPISYYILGRIL